VCSSDLTGANPGYWTTMGYDYLARPTSQAAADGSTVYSYYNEGSSYKPSSASSDTGTTVRSKDAWGRERWTRTDAFGRLVEAVEPDNGSASVLSGTNMAAIYAYDQLDRVNGITQGSQTRS